MKRLGFLFVTVALAACPKSALRVHCTVDTDCVRPGQAEICVPNENACAFADSSCPSGYRYDTTASTGAGDCVEASGGTDMSMDGSVATPDMTVGPAPSISTITPGSGPTSGGTSLTIVGNGFVAGARVSISGQEAFNVVVSNSQTISALSPMAPMGTMGTVPLVVTNPDGQTASAQFTYIVTSVSFSAQPANVTPQVKAPTHVAIADFNADGKSDLGISGQAGFSVFLGNGDGTFAAPKLVSLPSSAAMAATADINGDGKMDAAVLTGKNAYVLLGMGDGTFQSPKPYAVDPTYSTASALVLADLNGDKKLDIAATVNMTTGQLVVLLGDGTGNFTAHAMSPFSIDPSPRRIASAEFNGDGKTDLVVSDVDATSIGILLGNGDGSFQAQANYSLTGKAYDVALADLNSDTHPDLIVSVPMTINILLGNANGTFQTAQTVPLPTSLATPSSLALGDFNADGKPDLIVTGYSSGRFTSGAVMLGMGGALFDPGPTPIAGMDPVSSATADFSGDGKVDACVANFSGNSITVFLNTSM